MPKSPVQKENALRKRIESLEHRVKLQDDEVERLNTTLKCELSKRDKIIFDLNEKLDLLLSANVTSRENDEPVTEPEPEPKTEHDLLVIGDSLVRSVNGEAINPGATLPWSVSLARARTVLLMLSANWRRRTRIKGLLSTSALT